MEGKEEPGKVRNPVRGGTTGSEGGFEGSVHSFNEAIGLRMKREEGVAGESETEEMFGRESASATRFW
jgi:hypothetical protein